MKKYLFVILAAILAVNAQAQVGGPMAGGAPRFSGGMEKLFGNNSSFSADVVAQMGDGDDAITTSGKMAFTDAKSRFETDMAQIKSSMITPEAIANMKSMGLDKMISISRPDKKVIYLIYPNLKAYVEMPSQDSDTTPADSDLKIQKTELGKETINGHSCVKNKVVISDKKGDKHEATTWNATDLKEFPIKIEQMEAGKKMTTSFKDIKTEKPETSLFEPPTDCKKYASVTAMMQEVMMKKFGNRPAPPAPGQ